MALNTSNREIIAQRREVVSELRRKRLTQRQIVKALPLHNPPIVAPDGTPWSLSTICLDLKALIKEWRATAQQDIAVHVAEQYQSLEAMERKAWADGDLASVARAIALKMKLTGTESPQRIEHSGDHEHPITIEIIYADTTIPTASSSSAINDQD